MELSAGARHWAAAIALVLAAVPARAAELSVEWAPLAVTVDAYQVERRFGDDPESWKPIARVGGGETRFTDRSVTAGVRYCYRVVGVRGGRYSPPSPPLCSVATEAPPPPEPAPAVEAAAADFAASEPGAAPQVAAGAAPATAPPPPEAPRPSAPAAVDRDVKPIRRPAPVYPPAAILQGVSGWVRLRFTVTSAGTTRDIEVVSSHPSGVFDEAALDAARRFVYSPRTERGVPVDRPGVETEVTFTLVDGGGGDLETGRREPGPPR